MADKRSLNIALLEGNIAQAAQVSKWFENNGDYCTNYFSADEFRDDFREFTCDLILMDWMISNGSSRLGILYWLRKTLGSDIPIVFLSARQSETDIIAALRAGADDYLAKPIHKKELLARAFALARR